MSIGKSDKQSKSTKRREQNGKLALFERYARPESSPSRRTYKPTKQLFASQNLHPLVRGLFMGYAVDLRHKYKGHTIRNAAVFDSAIRECSRLGYIEVVNRKGDVAGVPGLIVERLKRVRHYPIWVMGPNFPDDPEKMRDQLWPSMKGDKIIWHHHPSRRKPTWRDRG